MASFTDLTGLAGIALALAAGCLLVLGCLPSGRRTAAVIAGLFFVLLLAPFGELPLAAYVRGMTGDLSITLLLLLGYAALGQACTQPKRGVSRRIGSLLVLVLAACALYPLALGAASYDSYRWGYGEPWFLGVLLVIALAGVVLRMPLVALSISLAVLAWAVGWYESGNLWDYLIDPLLAIYGVFALCRIQSPLRRLPPT
jgi:hypothetical protein